MHVSKYQLYVNVTSTGGKYMLRTMQIDLPGIEMKPAVNPRKFKEYLASRDEMSATISQIAQDNELAMVPDCTPFYLGFVIVSSLGHTVTLNSIVRSLMDAMQGVVYKDSRWCDGVSVIRDRDGDTNDCRIHVAWKEDPPKNIKHPLFGIN